MMVPKTLNEPRQRTKVHQLPKISETVLMKATISPSTGRLSSNCCDVNVLQISCLRVSECARQRMSAKQCTPTPLPFGAAYGATLVSAKPCPLCCRLQRHLVLREPDRALWSIRRASGVSTKPAGAVIKNSP